MIDLHVHSTVSDGEFTPERLVEMAMAAGLSALSVTDHDSLEGSRRAERHGAELGMRIVPGAEISASHSGKVLHVLGYFIDTQNTELARRLDEVQAYRRRRAELIIGQVNVELLAEGKTPMDLEAVLRLGTEKPLTRADLAQHLVDLGHVATRQEAFARWLEKFNVPNLDLSVADAIGMIHAAGGLAVLAHPVSEWLSLRALTVDTQEQAVILASMRDAGLDGLEVHRPHYAGDQQMRLKALATELGLVATGGSDFHGPQNPGSAQRVGDGDVPDSVLQALDQRHGA